MSPYLWIAASEEGSLPEKYFSIPTDSIPVGTSPDFEIYSRPDPGRPPVLYRKCDLIFTSEVLDRLRESKVDELYVKSPEVKKFQRFITANLAQIFERSDISTEEKASLAYYAAQQVVSDLFDDPRLKENVRRTKKFVIDMTEFMLQDKTDMANLMRMMAFDYDTYTHSVNVFVFSMALARHRGIKDTEALRQFGEGCLMHDIGKSLLDSKLVGYKGIFSENQYEEMKEHTLLGYDLLDSQNAYSPLTLSVVRSHHERADGTGYPDGLEGDQINPFVRMCALAEIFDAITTKRPYKAAENSFDALTEMKNEIVGGENDPYYKSFVEMISGG